MVNIIKHARYIYIQARLDDIISGGQHLQCVIWSVLRPLLTVLTSIVSVDPLMLAVSPLHLAPVRVGQSEQKLSSLGQSPNKKSNSVDMYIQGHDKRMK